MTALIIIIAILILIISLLLVPALVKFDVTAEGKKVNVKIIFEYAFIKFCIYPGKNKGRKKVKQKDNKKEPPKKHFSFEEAKAIYGRMKRIYAECKEDISDILKYAAQNAITFKQLNTDIKFDFESPMNTGIATGVVNGVVYNVLAFLDNSVGVKKHSVNIQPLFYNSNYMSAHIYGIVRLKNVHIMVILIKSIRLYFKIRKVR